MCNMFLKNKERFNLKPGYNIPSYLEKIGAYRQDPWEEKGNGPEIDSFFINYAEYENGYGNQLSEKKVYVFS